MTSELSVKPADVGASNRLRKHAHHGGNPRRASDSLVRLGDVDRAEAALIGFARIMRERAR
jgi:hypothetical protein